MWLQIAIAIGIFFVLSAGYAGVRQFVEQKNEDVPLSQIAQDIIAGKVTSLVVCGDNIEAI